MQVKGRQLRFSYWPMYRRNRRYGLQTHVYATDPWALVRSGIQRYCPAAARDEALAYLSQGKYFFEACGRSDEWAAKPLLLYYSFMNLAKAYVLTKHLHSTLDKAQHGLSEQLPAGGNELVDAYLDAYPSSGGGRPNLFADFLKAVSDRELLAQTRFDIPYLFPQIVAGHRLWAEATDSFERFVSIREIRAMQDTPTKSLWFVIHVNAATLSILGMTHKKMLNGALLSGKYREVANLQDREANEPILRFEQVSPTKYSHRPSDKIPALVSTLRHKLWTVANFTRPFREYYLYVAPTAERSQVLPQLLSVYALTYYLGSIVRYRPQHFRRIIDSSHGAQVQEFLSSQPTQFLYLLASEFIRRDIARAPLV